MRLGKHALPHPWVNVIFQIYLNKIFVAIGIFVTQVEDLDLVMFF